MHRVIQRVKIFNVAFPALFGEQLLEVTFLWL